MFIDRNIKQCHSPFGGAECFERGTNLLEFRSSERRFFSSIYKHATPPNGVKAK